MGGDVSRFLGEENSANLAAAGTLFLAVECAQREGKTMKPVRG